MRSIAMIFLIGILIASCTAQKVITLTEKTQLKFLGEYDIPHNQTFQNTIIGGLSGIDFDIKNNIYYLISDDRSAISPARFYTAKIYLNEKGIDSVQFVSIKSLVQRDGTVYPNSEQDAYHTPDPEAIRYNSKTRQLVWSSEGEKIINKDTVILENPSITIVSTNGNYIDSFVLPLNMRMQTIQNGPRKNGAFEGLSFFNHYKKLLVSVEEPLFEDGARAGLNDSSAWIRLIRFNVKSKKPEAQLAYQIDPVAYPANPPGAFKINGVPDILALNKHQLLVLERSFSSGRKPSVIKVYLADTRIAEDISKYPSLQNRSFHSIQKHLLLNMDDLGIYIDNVEGVTFGPRLPNGNQTLIFVSDNNFSKEEITQFFLFEITQVF
jgi:hypothetical protein